MLRNIYNLNLIHKYLNHGRREFHFGDDDPLIINIYKSKQGGYSISSGNDSSLMFEPKFISDSSNAGRLNGPSWIHTKESRYSIKDDVWIGKGSLVQHLRNEIDKLK